jgi:hypothetical protein
MSASFTDLVNTFTTDYEDCKAVPVWNANTVVTIGGVIKSQADSQRLKITSRVRCTQTELSSLMEVLKDFSATIYYTPSRKLFDKAAADGMAVVLTSAPSIEEWLSDGCEVVYHVVIEMEEVIA